MVNYNAIAISILSVAPLALAVPKPWDLHSIISRDDDVTSVHRVGNNDWNSDRVYAAPVAPAARAGNNFQGNYYDGDSFWDYDDSSIGEQARNERKRKNLATVFGTCDRKCHSDLLGVLKFDENTCRIGHIRHDVDDDNFVRFAGDDGTSLHFEGDSVDSLFFGNNDRAVDLEDYYEMDLRIDSCVRCLEGQDTKDTKNIDQLKKFNSKCVQPRLSKV